MNSTIDIHLFGSLQSCLEEPYDSPIQSTLKKPTPLPEILRNIKISPDIVQLIMVNHKAVQKNSVIHPGDRLALFPKEYMVFVDKNKNEYFPFLIRFPCSFLALTLSFQHWDIGTR